MRALPFPARMLALAGFSTGDVVAEGGVVGLIEVIKTFLEVRTELGGAVERFLCESGDVVDVGDPLVVVAAG
ncbi:MAG: hypothetical protein FJW96_02840 [Actinobacteria bacterium]|nr:hypothetical protein [Actinomycetota bacterium]